MNPMLFLDEPSRETLNISPQYFQGSEKHFKRYVSTPLSSILSDFSLLFGSENAKDLMKEIIDLLENSFKKGGLSNEDQDAIIEKTKEWKAVIIGIIKLRFQSSDFFLTDNFLDKHLFKKEKNTMEEKKKEKLKEEGKKIILKFVNALNTFMASDVTSNPDFFSKLWQYNLDFKHELVIVRSEN